MQSVEEVLTRMVGAFCTGVTSTVREYVSEDYVDHQGLGGQPILGADGFAHVVRVARGRYRRLDVSISEMRSDGDTVKGRLVWVGDRDDGRRERRETVETVRVEAGKAVEHWGQRL